MEGRTSGSGSCGLCEHLCGCEGGKRLLLYVFQCGEGGRGHPCGQRDPFCAGSISRCLCPGKNWAEDSFVAGLLRCSLAALNGTRGRAAEGTSQSGASDSPGMRL